MIIFNSYVKLPEGILELHLLGDAVGVIFSGEPMEAIHISWDFLGPFFENAWFPKQLGNLGKTHELRRRTAFHPFSRHFQGCSIIPVVPGLFHSCVFHPIFAPYSYCKWRVLHFFPGVTARKPTVMNLCKYPLPVGREINHRTGRKMDDEHLN